MAKRNDKGSNGASPVRLQTGFIITDSSFHPLWANPEAVQILQPKLGTGPQAAKPLNQQLSEIARPFNLHFPFRTDFASGRRLYICRGYPLGANLDPKPANETVKLPFMAFLFERSRINEADINPAVSFYRITGREKVALELLIQGLTTKDIAAQMAVSPNTVKAFLRSVMSKMGVATRTGLMKRVTDHA